MAKVRVNLYGPQTRETRGYADTERDVAVVTGVVSDLPASGTNIQLAEQLCIGSVGTAHPNYTGLELVDAQGHRLNDTSVWVVLLYGRTPASVPTIPATSNVREITEYVWDENQIGTATVTLQPYGGQETERLIYYYRSGVIPVSRFQMRTVLNEHPGTAIDALSGKVNATPYSIAGRLCGSATLRFDNAEINPFQVYDGTSRSLRFETIYNLTYKPTRWSRKQIPWGILVSTSTPEPVETLKYGTAEFNGAIPVHA